MKFWKRRVREQSQNAITPAISPEVVQKGDATPKQGTTFSESNYRRANQLFIEILQTHSSAECREIIERSPELLSSEAGFAINVLAAFQPRTAIRFFETATLLQHCREVGIDQAFEEATSRGELWMPPELAKDLYEAREFDQDYQRTAQQDTVDLAVSAWTRVLANPAIAMVSERLQLAIMNGASHSFLTRYRVTGNANDLEQALEVAREVVVKTPSDSISLPDYLNNLGNALRASYAQDGEMKDLEEAIGAYKEAVQGMHAGSPHLATAYTNLGTACNDLYAYTGRMSDLEQALGAFEQAVGLVQKNSPDLPVCLHNLSTGLLTCFERTGQVTDLERAISCLRLAVSALPKNSPMLPASLSILGSGLRKRYQRTGQLADLNEAIQILRQAVREILPDSVELALAENNLANALYTRYLKLHSDEDLDEAIQLFSNAVQHTPHESPRRPIVLSNYSMVLRIRYQLSREPSELGIAIRVCDEAVRRTPKDSPDLPGYLTILGNSWRASYDTSLRPDDLRAAQNSYYRACKDGMGVTLEVTVIASRNWGNWALERRNWQEAVEAYAFGRQAMDVLFVTQAHRQAKESWLKEAQSLPANAAYALAKLDRLEEAVETIEAGRARLLAEALEANRRDLERLPELGRTDLLAGYRDASQRLAALQQPASQPTSQLPDGPAIRPDYTSLRQQMEAARRDLDAAIAAIRQVPGYEDFFRSPSFKKIQQAALPGAPLVYLVTTSAGSVALVVHSPQTLRVYAEHDAAANVDSPANHDQTRRVSVVWLDDLTEANLREAVYGLAESPALGGYLGAYQRWLRNARDTDARRHWFDTLDRTARLLWDTLMAPLLDHLAHSPLSASRATLIPTGLLALLPLHAAWTEDAEAPTSRRYALDAVTFNYAASARALSDARAGAARVTDGSLLAVDNPDGSLVFSRHEVAAARSYFPVNDTVILAGDNATRRNVLDRFSNHPVYHFSTHGWAGWSEPLTGGLLMAEKATLTLADILDLRLGGARLAVLSACETGIPGTKLPDEVVSLPSGFAQVGVAGVVASLWSVNDMSTAMLMERFYRHWREDGLQPADALRRAQIWLRDATNEEMVAYFEQDVQPMLSERMPAAVAADFAFRRESKRAPDAREFAHPFWWAAFTMTGV